jgi:hypothetical protein
MDRETAVRVSGRAQNEGEHLEFRAHFTGWEMEAKKSRCDKLLTKSDCNLRKELLEKKDVLLIPHEWYPEHTPLNETPGCWFVPTEEILGSMQKTEGSHGGGRSEVKRAKTSESEEQMKDRGRHDQEHQCSAQRARRKRPPVNYTDDMPSDDSSDSEGSRDGEQEQLSQSQKKTRIRMCAADPRYITHEGDSDRGNAIIPMSEVRMLISWKVQLDEEVATVWMTITEMGLSVTDESHMVICSRDVREGKVTDRYLAPAI